MYRHIKTNEQVEIIEDNVNYYKLSNGSSIKKDIFFKYYVPIIKNEISTNNISSSENYINENHNFTDTNNNSHGIDPVDFLYSTNFNNITNDIKKIDTTRVTNDVPDLMRSNVKVNNLEGDSNFENNQFENNISLEERKKQLLMEYQRSHPEEFKDNKKFQEINDEENIPLLNEHKQMVENQKPKVNQNIDPETGLNEKETFLRNQSLFANQPDPYAEKVKDWKEKHKFDKYINNISDKNISTTSSENVDISKPVIKKEDMMMTILESFEKNFPIKIKIILDEFISEPIFIKMINKNLKGDIVEYYTDEIISKMLSDISSLKKTIYDTIYNIVYKDEIDKKNSKSKKNFKKVDENDENEVINENKVINKEEIKYDVEKMSLGTPTKSGKKRYFFFDENGEKKEFLLETAKKRKLKPYYDNI